VSDLRALVEELRSRVGASRVTLRLDAPGDAAFGVAEEALAAGVGSLRGERSVHLPTQPVVLEVQQGRQVVHDDCASAYDDPAFHRMREAYGGLAAQIVTPVQADGRVAAILSVHQLGAPRRWTDDEIAAASDAARRIAELL
jgi:GAF domain-containing protein